MAIYKSKNPTKDGRSYYFMLYKKDNMGINKKYKSKKYKTKPEARDAEAQFILKKEISYYIPFNTVAKNYFEFSYKTKKESTVYSNYGVYKKHIKNYFNNKDMSKIDITFINEWKRELEKEKLQISTMKKIYNVLVQIFDYAIQNHGLNQNIVRLSGNFTKVNDEVKPDDTKLRYITYDDFKLFISSVNDITWKTFFIFLFYTGMRKGEIQALTWNDIDFDNNEIIVNKTLSVKTTKEFKITNTKNNLNRKIKISKILLNQLKDYYNFVCQYSDFNKKWFVFGGPRFMPQTTIDRKKHYYFNLCDVKEITIHEFRHSHVSLLINEYIKSGQTDFTKFFLMMSDRMGHSLEVMQKTYMHLIPTVQNEIVDLLDNL